MQESLNKLIQDGISVNVNIPTKTWFAMAVAVLVPGIVLIITTQTFKKL